MICIILPVHWSASDCQGPQLPQTHHLQDGVGGTGALPVPGLLLYTALCTLQSGLWCLEAFGLQLHCGLWTTPGEK
jgi:hypothetical protein